MSKLSEPLKALINASHARPGQIKAPRHIRNVFEKIASEAESKNVGLPAWLCASTAATMTMNSPDSMLELHSVVTSSRGKQEKVQIAELMREVGLKCISFNGIPRAINCLGAFYNGLPTDISSAMSTQPTRKISNSTFSTFYARGQSLWKSVYHPLDAKLTDKLSQSHPDLPVTIFEGHYGVLLADPPLAHPAAKVGRVLTSIVAVSCLRAQTGVAPQVTSHVFGLRKAYGDGSAQAEGEQEVEGGKWLASDEGSVWLLGCIDRIVEAIGEGMGTTFAPGLLRAKL